MRPASLVCLLATLAAGTLARLSAQEEDDPGPRDSVAQDRLDGKFLSAFEGTPLPVVEKMLELAKVQPGEAVYDLGSGDGRILIMAAQRFGARGVGIELDPRRSEQAIKKIQKLGLMHQIQIIEGDVLEQDVSGADVITIYLPPYGLSMLKPHLEAQLRHGMRIVVCRNEMPGWKPTATTTVAGGNNQTYRLTLYEISRPGHWTYFSRFGAPE